MDIVNYGGNQGSYYALAREHIAPSEASVHRKAYHVCSLTWYNSHNEKINLIRGDDTVDRITNDQ